MIGKHSLQIVSCLAASAALVAPASALVYSPSQAQLFDITDVTADFSGGGALYTGPGTAYGLDGDDGVIYDMDFAPGTDGFSRVVVQQDTPELTDLSGFDTFDIGFMPDLIPMSVKTYINTSSGFYESPLITIQTGSDDRISLDLSTIPDPESVVNWGIQMFDPDDGTSFAQTARVFQVGEPPTIVETPLMSFETGFENWGGSFQHDVTSHAVDTAHASQGSQSLAIIRAPGSADQFEWGTEFYLNATDIDALGGRVVPDPDSGRPAVNATQQEVDDFAALFDNDIENTKFAFDVIVDEATLNVDPGIEFPYTSYILYLNDGDGQFWQAPSSVGVNPPAEGEDPVVQTVAFDLSTLEALGGGAVEPNAPFEGFNASSGIISIGIGVNTNVDSGSVFIDNIRLITEVFGAEGIEGDYDNGGQVEQTDLDFVLSNWGDTDISDVTGWVNFPGGGAFDGLVDQNELDGVLLNWGSTSAPDFSGSSVPEPAALGLLGLAAVTAGRRRR